MCSHSPDSYKTEAAKSEMTFAFMVFMKEAVIWYNGGISFWCTYNK